jgi:hypothetical protein
MPKQGCQAKYTYWFVPLSIGDPNRVEPIDHSRMDAKSNDPARVLIRHPAENRFIADLKVVARLLKSPLSGKQSTALLEWRGSP